MPELAPVGLSVDEHDEYPARIVLIERGGGCCRAKEAGVAQKQCGAMASNTRGLVTDGTARSACSALGLRP